MNRRLPERLSRADALRRRWRPGAILISERDLASQARRLTQAEVVAAWERFSGDGAVPRVARERVSLYLHALLCPTRCSYCHCTARQPQAKGERDAVWRRLLSDVATFGPATRGLTFRNVYFGGGTPSMFTARQLETLFDRMREAFRLAEGGERTIEMNPANAKREKLDVARQAGFDRVSFGIETLTPRVLVAHDRAYQRDAKVAKALEAALEAGFPHVNVDLLVLPGETRETFQQVVDNVVGWGPTEIHLYKLQRQPTYGDAADTLDYGVAWEQLREAAARGGYEGLGAYAEGQVCARAMKASAARVKQPEVYVQQAADIGSTLGLGPGAESMCRFVLQYTDYAVNGDATARYMGTTRSAAQEVRGALMAKMFAQEAVSKRELAEVFGSDALLPFAEVLGELQEVGWLEETPTHLRWCALGQDGVVAALAMATEAEQQGLAAWAKAQQRAELEAGTGPVGSDGWSVEGPDERRPSLTKLTHPTRGTVLFALEEDDGGPALARNNGVKVSYHGADVPQGAVAALREVLAKTVEARAAG